jgi:hypothetical protein
VTPTGRLEAVASRLDSMIYAVTLERAALNKFYASLNDDQTAAEHALQPVWGITLYMQVGQDITIGARVSKTQYQYTLVDVDSDELDHWAPILLRSSKHCLS